MPTTTTTSPPPAGYPTGADLVAYLLSLGIVDATDQAKAEFGGDPFAALAPDAKCRAAVAWWEKQTEWEPFLSSGQVESRQFDPPGPRPRQPSFASLRGGGRVLFLDGGLLSLTSLTVTGFAYEEGLQFWLRPDNAPRRGVPYTRIEFLVPLFAQAQMVVVTGVWGAQLSLSDDVRQAVLYKAADLCYPELALRISRGMYQIDDVNFKARYAGSGTSPLSMERRAWSEFYQQMAGLHRRLSL